MSDGPRVERRIEAIRDLRALLPEARALARSGHPANKREGKKALRHIDSEVKRLNEEIRKLRAVE